MDRDRIAAVVRQHAAEIKARGVLHLGLFGSVARGDASDNSDVDVVIDVAPGRKFSLIDLGSLRVYLSDVLRRETDIVVREDLGPKFRAAIERETMRIL